MHTKRYEFDTVSDYDSRMQLIRDQDFDRYFDALETLADARIKAADEIMDLARRHGCVMVSHFGSHRYYVHWSLEFSGRLRITGWDEYGPTYHHEIESGVDLEVELPEGSFTASYK